MIYLKLHETDNGAIIAMCDQDLIGRVLEDGDIVVNIRDYSSFYVGELIDPAAVDLLGEKVYSVNAIGEESVSLAIRNGIVDEANVRTIGGIPFAQSYTVPKK
ncbi:MAG: DUF424 family protein [Candidatus Marsarchaeota archaeon]|jgi:hypothetical protein|nr:DUF424 family protein [Candidatus Marsarchaeota archaeon]